MKRKLSKWVRVNHDRDHVHDVALVHLDRGMCQFSIAPHSYFQPCLQTNLLLNIDIFVLAAFRTRLDHGRCRHIAIRKKAARKSHRADDHGHVRGQNRVSRGGDIVEAGAEVEAEDENRRNDEAVHDRIRVVIRNGAIRPAIERQRRIGKMPKFLFS